MNKKKQSIKRVVLLVLVPYCFCIQVNTKESAKGEALVGVLHLKPDSNTKSSSMKQNKKLTHSMQKQNEEEEELKRSLKKPTQEKSIETLLQYVTEEAKKHPCIDPDVVEEIFSPKTKIGITEKEGGNIFDSRLKFIISGAEQAVKKGENHATVILNIRKWQLKQREQFEGSMGKLLEKQRYERARAFLQTLARQYHMKVKQISAEDTDTLIAETQNFQKTDYALQRQLNEDDKKFDSKELYQIVVRIAQKDSHDPAMVMYLSQQLASMQVGIQQEKNKSSQKNGRWW
ncbi:MAG: hypothetical protein WCD44_00930 [Candidatus Babeliales bacterium]|jgi:hypothetical protein